MVLSAKPARLQVGFVDVGKGGFLQEGLHNSLEQLAATLFKVRSSGSNVSRQADGGPDEILATRFELDFSMAENVSARIDAMLFLYVYSGELTCFFRALHKKFGIFGENKIINVFAR